MMKTNSNKSGIYNFILTVMEIILVHACNRHSLNFLSQMERPTITCKESGDINLFFSSAQYAQEEYAMRGSQKMCLFLMI
jgi:hypothetical protein